MDIYTRTGDDGTTGRPGGRRVSKTDPLIEAHGAVDELNSHVGLCRAVIRRETVPMPVASGLLAQVQEDLSAIGAVLAAAGGGAPPAPTIGPGHVDALERAIDECDAKLAPLAGFILPSGTRAACGLHVARAVCRRAERRVVAAREAGADVPAVVVQYLNRLSDLLFVLARLANRKRAVEDEPWPR